MSTDLLERAHDAAYRFPVEFKGFTAKVRTAAGAGGRVTATGRREHGFEFTAGTEDDIQWVREQVASILGHRWSTTFAAGDGRFPRTPEGEDPNGALVRLAGDPMNSAYRVERDEIREVHRTAGDTMFTIVVSGSVYTAEGRLPNNFSVYYWTAGALVKADQYRDIYAQVGGVWLPSRRTITTADHGGLVTRVLELTEHEVTA